MSKTYDDVPDWLSLLEESDIRPNKHIDLSDIIKREKVKVGLDDFYDFLCEKYPREKRISNRRDYLRIMKFMLERVYQEMITNLWVFSPSYSHKYYVRELIVEDPSKIKGPPFRIYWKKEKRECNMGKYNFWKIQGNKDKRTGRRGLKAEVSSREDDPHKKDYRAYLY